MVYFGLNQMIQMRIFLHQTNLLVNNDEVVCFIQILCVPIRVRRLNKTD